MKTAKFKKIAIEAALKAGSYIRKNTGRVRQVRYKSEINIVTEVDKKAERIIVGAIGRAFPRHDFLAEEEKYKRKNSDFKWIIDPLDGTTNFLHAFPVFCVSIALAYQEDIIVGVVYDPTRDELFHAEKGKGAFLNKKRIRVSAVKNIKRALLATGFAYNVRRARKKNIRNFIKLLKTAQAVRRAGSAALDMCYVACGRLDGFWEYYLHAWDTAAALRIVEEAGGKVTKLDEKKFSIYDNETLASNSKIHSQMICALSG
ncbi:MAG: inositol monophosphatase family protein [Candidatus Omnitrophota bacterium]